MRRESSARESEVSKRMSVGNLAPGIKVRTREEIMNMVEQRDIVGEDETADPAIYQI